MRNQSVRLAGAHEVREMLGVSRQRVYQLAARADFPTPVATLAQGKIWLLADIERWMADRRLPGSRALRRSLDQGLQALDTNLARVESAARAGRPH